MLALPGVFLTMRPLGKPRSAVLTPGSPGSPRGLFLNQWEQMTSIFKTHTPPPPPHLEKPAWPQICSQNLGGDDGVGRGSPGVASMQPQWPACLVASTFHPFKAVGRWFRRTGSKYGGTQAQNLDSPLLVCSALHSTSPVLLMGESLGRGNENKPRLKFQHPAFLRV